MWSQKGAQSATAACFKYSGGGGGVQLVFTAEPWQQSKVALPAGIYGSVHASAHASALFQTLNSGRLKIVKLSEINHVHGEI